MTTKASHRRALPLAVNEMNCPWCARPGRCILISHDPAIAGCTKCNAKFDLTVTYGQIPWRGGFRVVASIAATRRIE